MTAIVFTPTSLVRPTRTTSVEIFDLKTLIDDDILTWGNLLSSQSSSASNSDSVLSNPDGRNVPLLKPAIPKSYKPPQTDAQILLSFVEETLQDDALKDWEPFARNDSGRESRYLATTETTPVDLEKGTLTLSLPSTTVSVAPAISIAPSKSYSKLLDEGTRLSTPVDWKPFHSPDPLYDSRPPDDDSARSFNYALDDCLVSQGDTAKARRKRRKRAFEISGELLTGQNKLFTSSELARLASGSRGFDLSTQVPKAK